MLGSLRSFFRKRMPHMEPEQARAAKSKLALAYAVLGWNLIGLTVYWVMSENLPRTPSNSVDYAKLLGVQDATVIKFSGLKKVKEYDFHLEEEEIEEFHAKPKKGTTEAKEPSENKNTTVVEGNYTHV